MNRSELAKCPRGGYVRYEGIHPHDLRVLNFHGFFSETISPGGHLLRRDYPHGHTPRGHSEPPWRSGFEGLLKAVQ